MNAEIIAVGSELLLGQIVNTNARFLSQQLAEIGINVYFHTVVGDNPDRLRDAISSAERRADLIILTGGLGPTKDDLTKETISKHLNHNLVIDKEALNSIESYFYKTKRQMTENNKKQALVLEGSYVLQNDNGMAPGMLLKTNEKLYMMLPGPPKELEPMFLKYGKVGILNELEDRSIIKSRVLRFFGIGEALLESRIEDLIDQQTNPTIAPLASDGEVTLRLTAKHSDITEVDHLLNTMEKNILNRVGEYFYGYDDTTLVLESFKLLEKNKLTISCAESLTGGMFQSQLTSVPGSSSILKGGIVCYTNEVKETMLNVKPETLQLAGAVSSECAVELAENISSLLNTDIGISFTGVAGPSVQEDVPVGVVYISIAMKDQKTFVKKLELAGNRESIRNRTVKYGLYYLLKYINSL